jgi:hypothetical protein
MSAWELGRQAVMENRFPATLDTDPGPLQTAVGRVLTWIPADAVAIYAAAITALVNDPTDKPGRLLIAGGLLIAVTFVPLGAFAATKGPGWFTTRVRWRTALAGIAFLIWSPTVPNSGWQGWNEIASHPGWTVIICAAAGVAFSFVAQGIDNRYPPPPSG